jgi:hypothetical protein
MVEIQEEDGWARDGALSQRKRVAGSIEKEFAIRQAGKPIVQGQVGELVFGQLTLGDILHLDDELAHLAVDAAKERDAHTRPDHTPASMTVPFLPDVRGDETIEQLLHANPVVGDVVDVRDLLGRHGGKLGN